jgi:hypothetical protein
MRAGLSGRRSCQGPAARGTAAGLRGAVLAACAATVLFAGLSAGETMAAEITVSCRPGPDVDDASARQVCDEFLAFLRDSHPGRGFAAAEAAAAPGLDLTVVRAGPRSVGFELTWLLPDGTSRPGTPLTTAFYDRTVDATLRARFFKTFLQQNPLPF